MIFHLSETEQRGGEQRIVDEVPHVVPFTLLFGLGAHLVSYILPEETPRYAISRVVYYYAYIIYSYF